MKSVHFWFFFADPMRVTRNLYALNDANEMTYFGFFAFPGFPESIRQIQNPNPLVLQRAGPIFSGLRFFGFCSEINIPDIAWISQKNLFIYLFIYLTIYLSIYLTTYLSLYLSWYSINHAICRSTYLSISERMKNERKKRNIEKTGPCFRFFWKCNI